MNEAAQNLLNDWLNEQGDLGDKSGLLINVSTTDLDWPTHFDVMQERAGPANLFQKKDFTILSKPFADLAGAKRSYDLMIFACDKDWTYNDAWLNFARHFLNKDGILIAACANDEGGPRLEKALRNLGAGTLQKRIKYKCRLAGAPFPKPDKRTNPFAFFTIEGTNFKSRAGLFSSRKIDKGSELMIDYLPDTLGGKGADLGCGWGYLAKHCLEKYPEITLDLYDHHAGAIEAAKANLKDYNEQTSYHWKDLLTDFMPQDEYDWIVMNPPFHDGKNGDPAIGQYFILQAHRALKAGCPLYMVANRHLPYENTVDAYFSSNRVLADDKGYKVLEVIK